MSSQDHVVYYIQRLQVFKDFDKTSKYFVSSIQTNPNGKFTPIFVSPTNALNDELISLAPWYTTSSLDGRLYCDKPVTTTSITFNETFGVAI